MSINIQNSPNLDPTEGDRKIELDLATAKFEENRQKCKIGSNWVFLPFLILFSIYGFLLYLCFAN